MSLGNWCAPWSSKPVLDVKSALGEFDSHRHPPKKTVYNASRSSPANSCFSSEEIVLISIITLSLLI